MILRNHDVLAVGRSVGEAFTVIYFLERACAMQVAAQTGSALRVPEAHVQDVVERQAAGLSMAADQLVWPALKRRLARTNPGFDT